MQKKLFKGVKGGLLIISILLLTLCLISAATAKKHPNPPPPSPVAAACLPNDTTLLDELPNGRPFQILKQVCLDLLNAVCGLTTQVDNLATQITDLSNLSNQIGTFQYLSLSFPSGTGADNIPILLESTAPVFAEGGKGLRIEVTFVSSNGAVPASATDSFIMAAQISPESTTSINFIGTNSDGTQKAGNSTSFSPAPKVATIDGVASLVALTGSTFAISEVSSPVPVGQYFVKIFY